MEKTYLVLLFIPTVPHCIQKDTFIHSQYNPQFIRVQAKIKKKSTDISILLQNICDTQLHKYLPREPALVDWPAQSGLPSYTAAPANPRHNHPCTLIGGNNLVRSGYSRARKFLPSDAPADGGRKKPFGYFTHCGRGYRSIH